MGSLLWKFIGIQSLMQKKNFTFNLESFLDFSPMNLNLKVVVKQGTKQQ
jgi:hypothetical protein